MYVLGIAFGHKLGNTEIMVKSALKGAEELGAEVGFINGLYLNMRGCLDCSACFNNVESGKANYTKCVIKDDATALGELMLDADALIIGGAVYSMGMPAAMHALFERTHTDLAYFKRVQARREAEGGEPVDPRVFKPRPLGLISQGGSRTRHWVSMAAQQISKFGMSANNYIVDLLDENDMTRRGGAIADEALLARCREMGRHVAEAARLGGENPAYHGEPQGVCPVCHLNMLSVDGSDHVTCPLCGIEGTLKLENGKLSVDFPADQLPHSRLYWGGLEDHQVELRANIMERIAMLRQRGLTEEKLTERKQPYKDYANITLEK